jgi:cytochrome P450
MADVAAVFRDAQTFASGLGTFIAPSPEAEEAQSSIGDHPNLVITDPPRHVELRKAFNRPFLPRAVARYEEAGRKLVAQIIDDVIPRGECNFVTDIATKLPMAIICDMMQVPRGDWNAPGVRALGQGKYDEAIEHLRAADKCVSGIPNERVEVG